MKSSREKAHKTQNNGKAIAMKNGHLEKVYENALAGGSALV